MHNIMQQKWAFLMLSLLCELSTIGCQAATTDTIWTVKVLPKNQRNRLSVQSKTLYIDFDEKVAWTLRNIKYMGEEIVGVHGYQGSVVRAKLRKEDAHSRWIGSGHGAEKVKDFSVFVDGKKMQYEPQAHFTGRVVEFHKQSRLGPLYHKAETIFPASGDHIIEKHSYRVLEDLDEKFKYYPFLHCNNNSLDQWLALLAEGEELQGRAGKDDGSFQLESDVKAIIFYSETIKKGVAYVYPELYKGAGTFKNSIWDRKNDNKLYFLADVDTMGRKIGDSVEYRLKIIPFSAEPNEWKGKGKLLAQENFLMEECKMVKVSYGGWPNCIRLSNDRIELIATTDVGPRIIRFGYMGGRNLLKEYKDQLGKTGGDKWRIYGGHRLWHGPEDPQRTYCPDNSPIEHTWDGKTLKLSQPVETTTGIVKEIELTLDPKANHVKVLHRLINKNMWDIEAAPWCITVLAPKGRLILPQEPYRPHPECLLPARPLVLWHYTDMKDPRWIWGTKYIQLKQDPNASTKQKAGVLNKVGWGAYCLNDEVFIKRFGFDSGATYPDMGCNTETYTDSEMLEFETLGPLAKIPANGGTKEHIEHWFLFKAEVGEDQSDIDKKLLPIVEKTSLP